MSFDLEVAKTVGLHIWRIVNLDVQLVTDAAAVGSFYTGDCYIVLNTYIKNRSYAYDVHFWLGDHSSVDERGAAALLTVHLDDSLGGVPVQHREVQGNESALFMSYFKHGIKYLEGGVDSAFKKVDRDSFPLRLFHVKGKREVRAIQVVVATKSMNHGDVFVLDAGRTIFFWAGAKSNKFERIKGLDVARRIKDDERGGKAEIVDVSGSQPAPDGPSAPFWSAVGNPSEIADDDGDDDAVEANANFTLRIAEVSVNEGATNEESKGAPTATYTLLAEGKLDASLVKSSGMYVIASSSHIYVWTGQEVPLKVRKYAIQFGQQYAEQQGLDSKTSVSRVVEGSEFISFTSLFQNWHKKAHVSTANAKLGITSTTTARPQLTDAELEKLNLAQLTSTAAKETGPALPSDGELKVYRIENFQRKEVPKEMIGQFYSGDSYIVVFSYEVKRKPYNIIYFWQGRKSSTDEKASSAFLSVSLSSQLSGEATQARVVQGKEPDHFLSLFKGKMIVHQGGVDSGFTNKKSTSSSSSDATSSSEVEEKSGSETRLYHIKGTRKENTRAVQVEAKSSSLNSGDVFCLVTQEGAFVWNGQHASQEERSTATAVVEILVKGTVTPIVLEEGSETEVFWSALGGKTEYTRDPAAAEGKQEARLFHCSDALGKFKVQEVFNFTQDDLINEDVFILDTGAEVFVWIGSESTQQEKDKSKELALSFVENATDGRSKDTPIYMIHAFNEPANFACHFVGWDYDKAQTGPEDPYLKRQATLSAEREKEKAAPTVTAGSDPSSVRALWESRAQGGSAATSPSGASSVRTFAASLTRATSVRPDQVALADPTVKKYDLKTLQSRPGPADVDPTNRPAYLTDEEFQTTFGLSRAEFDKLPAWEKQERKRQLKL